MISDGCVYSRCGCVDPATGRQYGRTCPRLTEGGRHGSWYVRLELPAGMDGHRRRIRRGGYPSRKAAAAVLARLRPPRPGDTGARILTVGDWLAHWPSGDRRAREPLERRWDKAEYSPFLPRRPGTS